MHGIFGYWQFWTIVGSVVAWLGVEFWNEILNERDPLVSLLCATVRLIAIGIIAVSAITWLIGYWAGMAIVTWWAIIHSDPLLYGLAFLALVSCFGFLIYAMRYRPRADKRPDN